jgi:hypothetical protein
MKKLFALVEYSILLDFHPVLEFISLFYRKINVKTINNWDSNISHKKYQEG